MQFLSMMLLCMALKHWRDQSGCAWKLNTLVLRARCSMLQQHGAGLLKPNCMVPAHFSVLPAGLGSWCVAKVYWSFRSGGIAAKSRQLAHRVPMPAPVSPLQCLRGRAWNRCFVLTLRQPATSASAAASEIIWQLPHAVDGLMTRRSGMVAGQHDLQAFKISEASDIASLRHGKTLAALTVC